MITFPAWFKPEEDAPPVRYLTDAQVPKGWIHVPGDYNFQTGQWIDAAPAEDDDPRDIKALRADYRAKFGKKPFNGWDEAELRERLGE